MEITHKTDDIRGAFRAIENGKQAGVMSYTWVGETKFIIDHTEVNPEFKGQGIGRNLVKAAVDYAREHDLKIIPLCPFAKLIFDKTSDIQDVLT